MLFQEPAEPLYCSVPTFKLDWILLIVARCKVYRGEAFHLVVIVWHVVGGGVHLGDHQVLLAFVLFGERHVVGLQFLAVAAPGSVKLDEDVLLGVHDDLVKRFAHHDCDRSLVLRHRLRLDDGLQFSCKPKI